MGKEYLYRVRHKPTGLFYGNKKGRWSDTITNLSKVGKFYGIKKNAEKILKSDCHQSKINKAQVERYNLHESIVDIRGAYAIADRSEFELVTYEITEV